MSVVYAVGPPRPPTLRLNHGNRDGPGGETPLGRLAHAEHTALVLADPECDLLTRKATALGRLVTLILPRPDLDDVSRS